MFAAMFSLDLCDSEDFFRSRATAFVSAQKVLIDFPANPSSLTAMSRLNGFESICG
jgi:hypothetical protein